MRIECPSCHTAYDVPDDKVTGRKVRCSNCKSQWVPPGPVLALPAEPPEPPRPFSISMPEAFPAMPGSPLTAWPLSDPRRQAEPRRWPLIAAWCATLALVVVAVTLVIIRREAIMNVWPASERLFTLLR